jgi:Pentapeptide repeats (8 copies)
MPPLLTTMKERVSPIWKSATLQFERGRQWLMPRRRMAPWAVGSVIAALLLGFAMLGGASWYERHHDAIAPLLTLAAGVAVAGVALARHFAQTDADRQRRITESYSKAVEQLAHDKIEVRLGGIYTLERVSRESLADYWTVMETLCAFVRERARWEGPEDSPSETVAKSAEAESEPTESRSSPPTDIAAVLAVIVRRDKKSQQRESDNDWRLDFREVDLRRANLREARLVGADLSRANLSRSDLREARLLGANLFGVNLREASLIRANLSRADLSGANLGMADLNGADLSGANLRSADLRSADLSGANLSGADLSGADISGANLSKDSGADLSGAIW